MMIFHIIFPVLIVSWSIGDVKSSYIWRPTEEWTPCSTPCGIGTESQVFQCLKKTTYHTFESAELSKCSLKSRPLVLRNCTLGECSKSGTGSFVWQVSNWSACPKTCGGGAMQNRDVNCFLMSSKKEFLLSKISKCDYKLEPPHFIACAKSDCAPNFMTSKWKKCPETSGCSMAIRRRDVKCVSLLSTGKLKIQPHGICYRIRRKPPGNWAFCASHINPVCLDANNSNKLFDEDFEIKKDESEIHQMRHTKRLKVFVGQKAYVFAFTKLSIFCPVTKMHRSKITWEHGDQVFEYKGSSNERVKVNRKGILVIKEFHIDDAGDWTCKAGKLTAIANLALEQPSTGFDNWLRRHANNNYGMLNEESNVSIIRPESIMWVKTEWSPCSVTCESDGNNSGFQTRKVKCEQIETQYYKIIDDKHCPPNKPITKKKCKLYDKCPHWKVFKGKTKECSDICINIGVAKTGAEIVCQHSNKTVDSSFCDRDKLPNITCPNPRCQISYHYGPWSQCSLSCSNTTESSIRSRSMKCVWTHTTLPAFHLCQQNKISHQPLTQPCRVPKCILGCKDLTPACLSQSKFRCRSSLFFHYCCAFCKRQFS